MKKRGWASASSAMSGTSSTATGPCASAGISTPPRSRAAMILAPERAAHTWVRCVLPAPDGPASNILPPGPVGPAFNQAKRYGVSGADKEIVAPQRGAHRQGQVELLRHPSPRPAHSRTGRYRGVRIYSAQWQTGREPHRRRNRHRDQHADKPEQGAKHRQREDEPDRMQPHRRADKVRGQDIALNHLPKDKNPRDKPQRSQSPQN